MVGVEDLQAVDELDVARVDGPGPSFSMRTVYVFAVAALSTTSLRLRMMSVTSSTTSAMVVNSWSAPSMRIAVMAAPWSDESSTRRRELPR